MFGASGLCSSHCSAMYVSPDASCDRRCWSYPRIDPKSIRVPRPVGRRGQHQGFSKEVGTKFAPLFHLGQPFASKVDTLS